MRILVKALLIVGLILCFGGDTAPVTVVDPFAESAVTAGFSSDPPCVDGFLPVSGILHDGDRFDIVGPLPFPYAMSPAS